MQSDFFQEAVERLKRCPSTVVLLAVRLFHRRVIVQDLLGVDAAEADKERANVPHHFLARLWERRNHACLDENSCETQLVWSQYRLGGRRIQDRNRLDRQPDIRSLHDLLQVCIDELERF